MNNYEAELLKYLKLAQERGCIVRPPIFINTLKSVLPKDLQPQHCIKTWVGLKEYADKLSKRALKQSCFKREKRLLSVSEAIHSGLYLYAKKVDMDNMDWFWCPFCWRPVLDTLSLRRPERCELHETGGNDCRKVEYMLKKKRHKKSAGVGDRIPTIIHKRVRDMANIAFQYDFPQKSSMFPFIFKYLEDELSFVIAESHLENALLLLTVRQDSYEYLNWYSERNILNNILSLLAHPQKLPFSMSIHEKKALIVRAETWLSFIAQFNQHGGKRANSGRPKNT